MVLGFFLVGRLLRNVSISLEDMGLFRSLIWSWFNFGIWYLSRKLSIPILLSIGFCSRIWWCFGFPWFLLLCFHFLGNMWRFRSIILSWFNFGTWYLTIQCHSGFPVLLNIVFFSRIWRFCGFPQFLVLCLHFYFWFC